MRDIHPRDPRARPSVLVVDDDEGTRDTFRIALRLERVHVETAADGAGAIAAASATRFDLALIDWRLPDMSGTDVARRLVALRTPFVLMSAFLTTPIVVEAMRLGAIEVVDKPIDVREMGGIVRSALRRCSAGAPSPNLDAVLHAADGAASDGGRRVSAAERWARLVLKGCLSDRDLKTLEDWATYAGVSYSSLTESCRLLGIEPHEARDLMRVLRAAVQAADLDCPLEALLDVSDRRTLHALLERAGIGNAAASHAWSPQEILSRQHFVDSTNAGVKALRARLEGAVKGT